MEIITQHKSIVLSLFLCSLNINSQAASMFFIVLATWLSNIALPVVIYSSSFLLLLESGPSALQKPSSPASASASYPLAQVSFPFLQSCWQWHCHIWSRERYSVTGPRRQTSFYQSPTLPIPAPQRWRHYSSVFSPPMQSIGWAMSGAYPSLRPSVCLPRCALWVNGAR